MLAKINRQKDFKIYLIAGILVAILIGGLLLSGVASAAPNNSIGGLVWNDQLDADGIQDAGEPGIGGVTVNLYDAVDGVIGNGNDTLEKTVLTSPSGAYLFDSPEISTPNDYYVEFVIPIGSGLAFSPKDAGDDTQDSDANTGTGQTDLISLALNEGVGNIDAGFYTPPTIGDFVWNDLNANGVQDFGESGIGGATVYLYTFDDTLVDTQTTAYNGKYSFSGGAVIAGDYYVQFVTPTDFTPSPKGVGAANVDSDADVGTGKTAVFTVTAGSTKDDIDAGFFQSATLGNFVWDDINGNGLQDGGELGIPGVTVTLYDTTDAEITNMPTNASGYYTFTNLVPNTYYLHFSGPIGYVASPKDQGANDSLDSDIDTTTYKTDNFTLAFGEVQADMDAAFFNPGAIGDFIWSDLDGDGVQDGGSEVGIDGVTLQLYRDVAPIGTLDGSDVALGSPVTTASGGVYDFTDLPAGDYLIDITDTGGVLTSYALTIGSDPQAVTLSAGSDYNNADFGYQEQTASIGDFVWTDLNGDGVQDGGSEAGIDGVTLQLYQDVAPIGTLDGSDVALGSPVTTSGGGAFDFTGLAAGTYIVDVTDTGGIVTSYGLTGGTDPLAVLITQGQDYDGADFGYQQQNASIGDFVWNDLNGNGVQDGGGEVGIDGVTVDLIVDANGNGVKDGGETTFTTDTTAGGGAYDFTGLAANDYLVEVTDTGAVLTGFALTGGTNPDAVTITAGQDYDSADFGYQQQDASIGDFVWNDLNGNGVQDGGGEVGFDGVTVDLIVDANGNGVKDGGETAFTTDTTAGGGVYDFTGLAANDYLVEVTDTGAVLTAFTLTGGTNPDAVTITAGQDYDGADFGYQDSATASIGDFVWNDLNGNGVQDGGGEVGIDGVTVDLIVDANGNGVKDGGETAFTTDTTAGGGAYDFTGLVGGDYLVEVTDTGAVLTGFALTGGTNPDAVTITAGQDYDSADFGYQQQDASIGDFVWNDLNGNGVQDGGGEVGIDGVTVDLIVDANGNGVKDGGETTFTTDTTAGGGAYDFTGLAANDYLVEVTDTGAVLTGFALTGGTNPDAVTITPGQDYDSADFGYQQQDASIGDFVWNDLNGNGVQDGGGEVGFDGVTVDLIVDANGNGVKDGGETAFTTDTTAGGGVYDFTGLAANDYLVEVTDTGAVLTAFTLTGGTNPDAVTITAGQDYDGADFGYQDSATASIGDFVWNDLNGNGVQDGGGEVGIDGVTVDLIVDANGNGVKDGGETAFTTDTTAGGGAYDFTGLVGGDYLVEVTDTGAVLTGFALTGGTNPDAVTITAGQDYDSADFGYQQQDASIGDFVWNDLNGNGVQDGGGEVGIDGVTVDLIVDANGNGVKDGGETTFTTDTTAGGGAYDFTGLAANDYLVEVTDTGAVLTGFALTGGTNPDAVTITPGQDYDSADFGYQQQDASIGDFVWNDLNGNGVQDGGGEVGIDGVTLQLYQDVAPIGTLDGSDIALGGPVTTASGGAYDFTGLAVGTYIVDVTDTGGVLSGYSSVGSLDPMAVSIIAGEDYNSADFGYEDSGTASIGDFLWNDLNGDGVQDGGESGIDGVTIDLVDDANGNGVIDGGDSTLSTLTTSGGGLFDFTGLIGAKYIVDVTDTSNVLTGFILTTGFSSMPVTISAGEDKNDADFGFKDPSNSMIGDIVWNDRDGNGVLDPGEPGIAGVNVNMIGAGLDDAFSTGDDVTYPVQTTDANGAYNFTGLTSGKYRVNVDAGSLPSGTTLTGGADPHNYTLVAGEDYNGADFGYQGDASINGTIWFDEDGDGAQNGSEGGLGGVVVYLDINNDNSRDTNEPFATTNGSGSYLISGLHAGSYKLRIDNSTVPSGYYVNTDAMLNVTLAQGESYTGANFGYVEGFEVYIPLMLNNYISAPDLVITSIEASSDVIEVVVENQGTVATTTGFWVDFYIDPDPVPTHENQSWDDVAAEGIVWGVNIGLSPGEVVTLTYSTDPTATNKFYSDENSSYSGTLTPGTPIYAQVDSVHLDTSYGGILEIHEINGDSYNNIKGGTAVASSMLVVERTAVTIPDHTLLLPTRN